MKFQTETALDERTRAQKRKAAQKAMSEIAKILKPRPRRRGKSYRVGEVVRIQREAPPNYEYNRKWFTPYKEKVEILEVQDRDHYLVRSQKSGKVTRERAERLAPSYALTEID